MDHPYNTGYVILERWEYLCYESMYLHNSGNTAYCEMFIPRLASRIDMVSPNRKCQDYVYIKWKYWSTM